MNSKIIKKHMQKYIAIYCKISISSLIILLLSVILTSCGGGSSPAATSTATTSPAEGYVLSFSLSLNSPKQYLVMSCNIATCTDLSNSIVWSNESGATVSIDGLVTTTDSTGHWQINNIPVGTYPIYVNSSLDFDRDGCAIYSGITTTSFIFNYLPSTQPSL